MTPERPRPGALYALAGLAVASAAVYVAVAAFSRDFGYARDAADRAERELRAAKARGNVEATHVALAKLANARAEARAAEAARPVVPVLLLFSIAFLLYFAALAAAVRSPEGRGLALTVLGGALAFRLILLLSTPIQPGDPYRAVWDGNTVKAGPGPYRYSPDHVVWFGRPGMPGQLGQLARARDGSPAVRIALERSQNPELPSGWPPLTQAAFALAAYLTPAGAELAWHVVAVKACLLVFDLGTLVLLLGVLRGLGRHPGWAVAYGWCPLLIKEVANSGHMDSVAVFFTTLGLVLAARALGPPGGLLGRRERARAMALMTLAALALAAGVGAELYPLALGPLLVATWLRSPGRWRAAVPLGAFAAAALLLCWPLLPSPPPPPVTDGPLRGPPRQDPSLGVRTFLRGAETNDLIFRVLRENVAPPDADRPAPWFAVVPARWREVLVGAASRWAGVEPSEAPFFVARVLTGLAFLVVAGALAWRAAGAPTPARWLECAFLTLAWLWLLSPAQSPWYWLWVLPLLPFARGRAWLAVSAFAMLYYLRPWLAAHWPEGQAVAGGAYAGEEFFDYVGVWLQYAPWLAWLAAAWALRREAPEEE